MNSKILKRKINETAKRVGRGIQKITERGMIVSSSPGNLSVCDSEVQALRNRKIEILLSVIFVLATGFLLFTLFHPLPVWAAPNLSETSKNIHSTAITWVKPALTVVIIVVGFILILGGQRGSETAKARVPAIILGTVAVVLAIQFSDTFFAWISQ